MRLVNKIGTLSNRRQSHLQGMKQSRDKLIES